MYLQCIYNISTIYLQNIYNYIYIQNDFVSGSLAVPGAEDILDMVEDLSKLDIWYQVFYTQVIISTLSTISTLRYLPRTGTLLTTSPSSPTWGCGSWTPPGSVSTTPTWRTSACSTRWIYTVSTLSIYHYLYYLNTQYLQVVFKRYPPYRQKLWPDHCIQGSDGRCQYRKYAKIFVVY